jgi:TetR/AcrR family transcriptional repressor of nem operon
MSRTRKTAPADAIIAAIALFWRNGFAQAGTRAIDTETGITRFTLQTSYGGKMALFLQALDTYLDMFEAGGAPTDDPASLADIADWFEGRAAPSSMIEQSCFGCLMLNAIAEFGATDDAVTERAQRYFTLLRDRFHIGLDALKARTVLPLDFDTAAHAEILVACAIGTNVVVRSAGKNLACNAMAMSTGRMIRSWGDT